MNLLYSLNGIRNHLDERLIDCFCEQNPNNKWLSVSDLAGWVFQTNKPNNYHKRYTQQKLNAIVGMRGGEPVKFQAFDYHYDPEIEGSFLYRLKDPSTHARSKRAEPLNKTIEDALSTSTIQQPQEVEEYPF